MLKAQPPDFFARRHDFEIEAVAVVHEVSFSTQFKAVDVRFFQCHTAFLPSRTQKKSYTGTNTLLCVRLCVSFTFLLYKYLEVARDSKNVQKLSHRLVSCTFLHNFLKSFGGPNEIRTRVAALKGRCPRPLDDRTVVVNRPGFEPGTPGLKVRCSAN